MANVDLFQIEGFLGANLTWNWYWSGLGDELYWDIAIIPNSANESLTINSKTFKRPADGDLQLWVNCTNNTNNDTYWYGGIIRVWS